MLCVYFKALKFPPKTHSSDNCVVSSAPERHRDESLLSRVRLVVVVVSVFTHFHNSPSPPLTPRAPNFRRTTHEYLCRTKHNLITQQKKIFFSSAVFHTLCVWGFIIFHISLSLAHHRRCQRRMCYKLSSRPTTRIMFLDEIMFGKNLNFNFHTLHDH